MESEQTYLKCFYRKTRRGSVVKIINDKYLNNNLEYGTLHGNKVFPDALRRLVDEAPHNHILILDSNILIHQIDLLEHKCPGTAYVVLCQTVLQEVKHRNLSVFRRACSLLSDSTRSFIFFPNEVAQETERHRLRGQSPNDANDFLVRETVRYFSKALNNDGKAILITNDEANRKICEADGLSAFSMKHYAVKYLDKYPELMDIMSAAGSSQVLDETKRAYYSSHLSTSEILKKIKEKTLFQGVLRVKANCWWDCYAIIRDPSDNTKRRSVRIIGKRRVNRAFDGDIIAVELCDSEKDDGEVELPDFDNEEELNIMVPATNEASIEQLEGLSGSENSAQTVADGSVGYLSGRVVGIIRRNWKKYAGSLEKSGKHDVVHADSISTMFLPVNKRIPPIQIHSRRKESLMGNRILVSVDDWPESSLVPLGHYVSTLGKDGDREVESQVLLHEFDVPCNNFSAEVMACLPDSSWKITDEIIGQRRDLRSLPVVSIDPPGCKDIDDALHCIQLLNGNIEAGVHIADVTHFVHPDSALDKEASFRSTSTYLVDRRLDMLPSLLTTELCSLRCTEDHLAFSVLWELTPAGEIVSVDFCKSIIRSKASMTYGEAQVVLDDPHSPASQDPVVQSVLWLNRFAKHFRNLRLEQGALTLASPEVRFQLDSSSQDPTDVMLYSLKESNALVEEWMLLANITVGKKILRHFPSLAVLRRHQPPSTEQFAPLLAASSSWGVTLDISSSKTLADSLDAAIIPHDPYFNQLLRILSTRCMMPAQYFCSGELRKEEWHHYGLAAPVYTHFTSPIRRYADVLVHRLLAASIGYISLPANCADRLKVQEVCVHMNRRHKAAQHVQRASVNLYTLLYFRERAVEEDAYILSLKPESLSVLVPRFGVEGSISIASMGWNTEDLMLSPDQCTMTLTQESSKITLRVLEKVRVSISVQESDGGERKVCMALAGYRIKRSTVGDGSEPGVVEAPLPLSPSSNQSTGTKSKKAKSGSFSSVSSSTSVNTKTSHPTTSTLKNKKNKSK